MHDPSTRDENMTRTGPERPLERVTVLPAPPGMEQQVVCAIWRELLPDIAGADVVGTVPANAYACLNVVATGDVRVAGGTGQRFPSVFICGPMTAPLTTLAGAPLRSLSVVMQPWLLSDWFGLAAHTLADTWVDGRALAPFRDACIVQAMLDAVHTPGRLAFALQALVAASAVGPEGPEELCRALQDTGSVAAAALRVGLGVRQFERRFVQTVGISPKRWLTTKRFEASLVQLAQNAESLAGVAAVSGYADQAHMTRAYRQVGGHTPGQTREALGSERSGYWAFRPAMVARSLRPEAAHAPRDVGFVQSRSEDGR